MMNRLMSKIAALVVIGFCSASLFAETGARYVVVLKRGANAPDIAALGGRIESKTWWSLTVVIPESAAKTLEGSPAVESLQRATIGTSDATPPHHLAAATNSFA